MHQPTPQVTMTAVTKCSFKVLPHSLYAPDLAPSDFCLFPNLKTNLCGRNFGSTIGIIDAVDEYFSGPGRRLLIWRDKQGISKLEQCFRKNLEAKGDYIEK